MTRETAPPVQAAAAAEDPTRERRSVPWTTPPPVSPSVWANREFRALWIAYTGSLVGDQLARVALTVLLYSATGSAVWAASGTAVTLLAPVIGGPLLGGIADRIPRREVMIACDVASAVLLAAMALPGMPLPAMVGLLLVASLLSAPFSAARAALARDVFPDNEQYAKSIGVMALTIRVAMGAGLVGGGIAVAALGARPALLVDAVTFAASALLVRLRVAARPAARRGDELAVSGFRVILRDPILRTSAAYGWLAAFIMAPYAIVAPYATKHGGGPAMIGGLLGVQAIGAGVATWLLTSRVRPQAQTRWLVPGAVLPCAPLVLLAEDPGVVAVAALCTLSAVGASYQVVANTLFQSAVPNEYRAAEFEVVSGVLLGVQGVAMLAVAALAGPLGLTGAVAAFGAAGTLAAVALAPAGRRCTATSPPRPEDCR